MSWKDMEELPLSTAIFPGSGRLDGGDLGTIGDSWLWVSGRGGVCGSLLLHFAVAWSSPHHPPPPDPLIPPTQGYHPTSLLLEAEGFLTHPQEEKGALWAHDGGQLFWGAQPVFTGQFSNMHEVLGSNQCWGRAWGSSPFSWQSPRLK